MYVRGSDKNIEYKRDLNSFFRGIVINDADPKFMQRVKIFIPEITNFESGSDNNVYIAPHNVGSLPSSVLQKLDKLCPWAEQASGLFGERGLSHYSAKDKSQVSKATYVKDKTASKPPNAKEGGALPRQQIANTNNAGAGSSIDDFARQNPNAASYLPKNSGPLASGMYGVPSVGSKVWVFFDRGDINFPVYFASCPTMAETLQVNNDKNYPTGFSTDTNPQGAEDTPPEPRSDSNLNRDRVTERSDLDNIDPETKRLLYELMQSEVGGQGREAQLAFMETVSNRAAAEGRSIHSIVTDRRYYEPLQRGITRPVNNVTEVNYNSVFNEVVGGSNITRGATHNASAGVARRVNAGGYDANINSIIVIGGETFYNKEFPREQNWLKQFNSTS
tara:strand:+ start:40 stop:1209 length:1170 start_codon:yes stop_codon:yes gene_type:complete